MVVASGGMPKAGPGVHVDSDKFSASEQDACIGLSRQGSARHRNIKWRIHVHGRCAPSRLASRPSNGWVTLGD
jgi:hypothetical protein